MGVPGSGTKFTPGTKLPKAVRGTGAGGEGEGPCEEGGEGGDGAVEETAANEPVQVPEKVPEDVVKVPGKVPELEPGTLGGEPSRLTYPPT